MTFGLKALWMMYGSRYVIFGNGRNVFCAAVCFGFFGASLRDFENLISVLKGLNLWLNGSSRVLFSKGQYV